MVGDQGFGLVSQEIRELITSNKLIGEFIQENQIQPSSFEPTIGTDMYILDTEEGVFRPERDSTVQELLKKLPQRRIYKVDITSGFEIKKGFTYLFPLRERINIGDSEYIKSSTKSSFGRLFLNCRMLADYTPCFDEVNAHYTKDKELGLWLMVQPLAFNMIVYPGIAFNQLRFFRGFNAQLNAIQILDEFTKNPLFYERKENGDLLQIRDPVVTDGLQIHLDVSGKFSNGIGALRARHNPNPIDLSKKDHYDPEDFFQPIMVKDNKISVERGEYYLFASKEVLKIPIHLNAELKTYSHVGIAGPLHFAGFIDNGFEGDLVFEVRSDEVSRMKLVDNMPISKVDVFRTREPDKVYGSAIGSHYHKQVGHKPAKYFKAFTFNFGTFKFG